LNNNRLLSNTPSPAATPLSLRGELSNNCQFVLSYKQKKWRYNSADYEKKADLFVYQRELGRFNKNGNNLQRADLIERVIALGFTPAEAFEYVFPAFSKYINNVCNSVFKKVQNAVLSFNPDAKVMFKFKPEHSGFHVDRDKLYGDLLEGLKGLSVIQNEASRHPYL